MVGLLIPHGHAEDGGQSLAGRGAGVTLDAEGRQQADALAQALTWVPLSAVYSSPLERAVETAHPLANDHGLDVHVRPALTDTNGESLADVQRRVFDELMTLAKSHQGETIAIVTHTEPIRCVLASLSGKTLDEMMMVELSPTHVTAVGITPSGIREVLGINLRAQEVTV